MRGKILLKLIFYFDIFVKVFVFKLINVYFFLIKVFGKGCGVEFIY